MKTKILFFVGLMAISTLLYAEIAIPMKPIGLKKQTLQQLPSGNNNSGLLTSNRPPEIGLNPLPAPPPPVPQPDSFDGVTLNTLYNNQAVLTMKIAVYDGGATNSTKTSTPIAIPQNVVVNDGTELYYNGKPYKISISNKTVKITFIETGKTVAILSPTHNDIPVRSQASLKNPEKKDSEYLNRFPTNSASGTSSSISQSQTQTQIGK